MLSFFGTNVEVQTVINSDDPVGIEKIVRLVFAQQAMGSATHIKVIYACRRVDFVQFVAVTQDYSNATNAAMGHGRNFGQPCRIYLRDRHATTSAANETSWKMAPTA